MRLLIAPGVGGEPKDDPRYVGMPKLNVVLADPRLANARDHEQAHDWAGAARLLDATRMTLALDDARACAWAYVSGRLHLAAGEWGEAAALFDRASSPVTDSSSSCPLARYAALHQAQALVRLGRYDDAIARARVAGDDIAANDEVELVLADAHVGKGNRISAVPIWRALLATSPRGLRWADSAIQLATALNDGVDGSPELHAREAFDLATRVVVEAPAAAERIDVAGLRSRASSLLGRGVQPQLSLEERAQQAQAWLESAKPKRAIDLAEALLKAIPRGGKDHREAGCRAAMVRAQAKPRGNADDAADAWGSAIARCEGEEALVTALYSGGKASASAHRPAEALERFAKVEKLFPMHRLADDACFRGALVICDQGDEPRGLAMLASLPDNYPDGDMGGEALFRVALARLGRQDFDGAREALDRLLSAGLDGGRSSPGRGAYFRARVSQLSGDVDDAQRRYAAIISEQPLGYYMLLAHARLREMSEDVARSTIEAGVAREPSGPFLTREHPEIASPGFERFERLLEV
ncbi:MAG: hypothetical protein M3O46_08015, partial [Myxococcota bacterium]|nr:hypothetical protein [Myxococcota bacterium]